MLLSVDVRRTKPPDDFRSSSPSRDRHHYPRRQWSSTRTGPRIMPRLTTQANQRLSSINSPWAKRETNLSVLSSRQNNAEHNECTAQPPAAPQYLFQQRIPLLAIRGKQLSTSTCRNMTSIENADGESADISAYRARPRSTSRSDRKQTGRKWS